MAPTPHLSIIIPAYNEESRILPSLQKIHDFISTQAFLTEVIVVDDCSTDRTFDRVNEFISGKSNYALIQNERNIGKGGSVRRGMGQARGKFRLFTDADLSTPIEEVNNFLNAVIPAKAGIQSVNHPRMLKKDDISGFDMVIGSRRVKGANVVVRQPIFREAAGRLFSVLVRLLTLRGFIDTQCGFKLFTQEAAENIFPLQTIPGFGFDVELLFIAARRFGYKIKEAPVPWTDSPSTRVRLFRDSTMMFLDLIRIRINYLRGEYN